MLGNTYHLHLRPGDELIARRGGLHRFIGWRGPMLTDSGGYQVFSLAERRSVDEEGVHFQSHVDGARTCSRRSGRWRSRRRSAPTSRWCSTSVRRDPRRARRCAASLELTARGRVAAATLRWRYALRAPTGYADNADQAQFGIVQGGVVPGCGAASARATARGRLRGLRHRRARRRRAERARRGGRARPRRAAGRPPRYLMGVGTPADLVEASHAGVDLFDCVLPTRNARNGQLFTRAGRSNIKNARFAEDDAPARSGVRVHTCCTFSRAYLRHLFVAGEMTGSTLNTLHNLSFYLDTMKAIREAIAFGTFEEFRQDFHRSFVSRLQTS